jgi:hypothetical protein
MPLSGSVSGGAYSTADRLLHRLALAWRPVLETTFDVEGALFGRAADAIGPLRPIFVCGFARAGTSLVTRLIADSAAVASPAYRDMPFPLAPNLWSRLSGRQRRVAASPRGHGDGLAHDLDTPEAIEEAFWRCFEGPRYLRSEGIIPAPPEMETMSKFRRYMALVVLRARGERYLSKNNNNVIRLQALADAFPDALFVHPFRSPAAQAESLRKQHERTCDLQRQDRFRLKYSGWLAHREFGLGHLPFLLPGEFLSTASLSSLSYWLTAWNGVYRYLLDLPGEIRKRQFFLDYDSLTRAPGRVLNSLAHFLMIDSLSNHPVRTSSKYADLGELPSEVSDTHRRLLDQSAAMGRFRRA